MDLEIEASLIQVKKLLEKVGFEKVEIKKNGILEAIMSDGWGRFHVLGIRIEKGKVYLDIHRDSLIHFAFIGVDYKSRPRQICEKICKTGEIMGMKCFIIGGTSWFSRKNKALFRGIRL